MSNHVITNKADFDHAARYTFTREDRFNNVPPDFWKDNVNNLPCRYDHEPFRGPIYSYPTRFVNNEWSVRGVFCSPHCVKKFITTQKGIPSDVYTLFTLMLTAVYNCKDDVTPAADIEEYLYNPEMDIETWRSIPKQHISLRLCNPMIVPFRMEKLSLFSYPAASHPAHIDVGQWNSIMAERGKLPDPVVQHSEVANHGPQDMDIDEDDRQDFN